MQELPTNKRFIVYTSSSGDCLCAVLVSFKEPLCCPPEKHCPSFLPDLYLQPYPHDPLLSILLGGVQEVIRHMEFQN